MLHPATASHTSAMHDCPLSHESTTPPPVHCPEAHVRGFVHDRSEHEPARHCTPLLRDDHADTLFAVAHSWHALPGFPAASA